MDSSEIKKASSNKFPASARDGDKKVWFHSLLTGFDVSLFISGKHFRLYEKLGSHVLTLNGTSGTYFAVWAPNAKEVNVTGEFNAWNKSSHQLYKRWDASGIWEGFIPGVSHGDLYKYAIHSFEGNWLEKGDPFARRWELPPGTASVVWDLKYKWKDKSWLKKRPKLNALDQPISVLPFLGLPDHWLLCRKFLAWHT